MDPTRIIAILEAYGANPEAWPEAERTACEAALAADPAAYATTLTEAQAADALFAGIDEQVMPEGLAARLIEDAPRAPAEKPGWAARLKTALLPQGHAWPAGAAFACLLIGIAAGLTVPTTETTTISEEDALLYTALGLDEFGAGFEELN